MRNQSKARPRGYVLGVNVQVYCDVVELATIAHFMEETKLCVEAKFGSVIGKAVEVFSDMLREKHAVPIFENENQAIVALELMKFPMTQIYAALERRTRGEDRAALKQETIEMFGMSTLDMAKMKQRLAHPGGRQAVEDFIETHSVDDEEFARREAKKRADEAENMRRVLEMAKQSGMIAEEEPTLED